MRLDGNHLGSKFDPLSIPNRFDNLVLRSTTLWSLLLVSCAAPHNENLQKTPMRETVDVTVARLAKAWEPEIYRIDSSPKSVLTAILDGLRVNPADMHGLITNPQIERGQQTAAGEKVYAGIGYWKFNCSINRLSIPQKLWKEKCPTNGSYKLYSIAVEPSTIEGKRLSISNEEERDFMMSLSHLKSSLTNDEYVFDSWSNAYAMDGAYSLPYPLRVLAAYKTDTLFVIKSFPATSQNFEKINSLEIYLIDKDAN